MKITIRKVVLHLLAVTLFWGISYGLKYAYIGSSYAAKIACSCHFLSGRELADIYATAQDLARFGQLYLQDGIWNGERIVPEGWAKYSGTETPNSNGRYAAHFWVDHNDKEFPADAYLADGFEGQHVNIIPSENMVIVRLGCTHGQQFNNTDFVKDILKAKK